MDYSPAALMCIILAMSRAALGSCPLHKMSKAETLHQQTAATFNDSSYRTQFEHRRVSRASILSNLQFYIKHCFKGVLTCGDGYQTYSGVCNNVRNHKWGAVDSCLLRVLPANYADGVAEPASLPFASTISVKLRHLQKASSAESSLTNLFFAFGQFLAHDIANSVISQIGGIDCCDPAVSSQEQCEMRIDVTADPFFRKQNVSCINFIRSARCPCNSGARDQMNGATSFIDLSQVYGNDELRSTFLKDRGHRHLLRTEPVSQLPLGGSHCTSSMCFIGGDERINQQAALTTLHTLFLRNHNYLAEELKKINPQWKSSTIFEEARKISMAQYQVVLLKEFLPLLLGNELLETWGLNFETFLHGASIYDENLEPGIFNEFLAAAFRLHLMVPEKLGESPFKFFNVDDYFRKKGDSKDRHTSVVRELISTRAKNPTFPASDLVSHHVYDTDGDFGLDLIAINIQRGRDHGLRPYVEYLAEMKNIIVNDFDDLSGVMDDDVILVLRSAYAQVSDVDLFVGGHLEKKAHGLLGPVMAELVIKQIRLIITADRFFLTHRKYFTENQFDALMRTTSTDILCVTTDLSRAPKNPFEMGSKSIPCQGNMGLNLSLWQSTGSK